MRDANVKIGQDTNGVTSHGDNIKGYWNAVLSYGSDIWDCLCFIADNSWKWWKWGSVWNHICQIGIDVYYINEEIDNTADESFGTAISTVQLLITSVTTLDTTIQYGNTVSSEFNSNLNTKNLENTNPTFKNNIGSNKTQNNDTQSNDTQNVIVTSNGNSTPIDQLHQGDVVIYKSQDKYLRYLQYISQDNQTVYLKGRMI